MPSELYTNTKMEAWKIVKKIKNINIFKTEYTFQ